MSRDIQGRFEYAGAVRGFESFFRLGVGFVFLGVVMTTTMVVCTALLPWRVARIKFTNHIGTVAGSGIMWITGCPLEVVGHEKVHTDKPVIYAANHTSIYDAFTSIWLSPVKTVGVAKKEIIYYPFYGLAWLLSGHLRIDRANTARGKESLRAGGDFIRKNGLHVYMFPEGTRATNGRLKPLKKGIVHLALQTGLPIMPVITRGAHLAWDKGTFRLRREPIRVEFLDPIETTDWTENRIPEQLEVIRQAMLAGLPPEQRPLEPEINPINTLAQSNNETKPDDNVAKV
ncbi:MAG: lysophospholipid acyltransferase family protein [Myxococcota bacterium]